MKKILLSLLAMLVMGVSGAWADYRVMPAYVGQLGLSDNSTPSWTYQSKYISIAAGETVEYTFTNYMKSTTTDFWDGWICEGTDGTNYFDVRMDGNSWVAPSGDAGTSAYSIAYSGDWYNTKYTSISDYMTDMTGATVTLKVTRDANDANIIVAHTVTTASSKTYSGTFTITGIVASSSIKLRLIAEGAHQDISKLVKTDAAGTASTYENYTSYITNPGFESDAAETVTPTGWTVTGDEATADNPQDKTGWVETSDWIEGTKLFYSGYNGRTLSQTLSNLPAGAYTLYAQAGSWGEGNQCYLTVNGKNSANFTVEGSIVDLSQNFGIAEASDVTIGSGASWGRRIDNFTLVRTGDYVADPNWKIDFSALGLTADETATVSDEVSSGLGTVTIGTTALDTRFGVKAGTSWKFYAKGYFQNINNGGRDLGVFGAKAGQLIVLNATAEATPTTNATLKFSYGNQHVYEVTADGDVVLNMPKNSPIYSIQVSNNLYTYSVKAKSGETELGTIAVGVADKGTSATTFWSKYQKVSDQWYVSDETTYGATLDETTPEKTINYSASTITQFFEVNDDMNYWRTWNGSEITGNADYSNGNGVGVGSSSGDYAYISTKSAIPAGTYEIGIYAITRNSKTDDVNVYTSTDGTDWTEAGSFTMDGKTGLFTTNITLAADSYIKFSNTALSSNMNHYVDYVTFAPVYAYSVKVKAGETTADIISGSAGAGKEIYWSKYQKVGDKWYSVPSTYMTVSATESNDIVLDATAENIVDFIEAENMTLSKTYGNYSGNNASAGAAMAVYAGANLATTTTVAAGTYYFGYYGTVRRSGQDDFTFQTSANGTDWTDAGTITMTDNEAGLYFTDAVTLEADSYVRIVEKNSKNTLHYVDYMVIQTEKPVPTAISNVNAAAENAATTAKVFKGGKLVIIKNGAEFNAAGQQMK